MFRIETHRLPGRIAALMLAAVATFALSLGGAVAWLTLALDRQSQGDSEVQVANAFDNLLDSMSTTVADNAKWDDAFVRAAAEDDIWLYDNIALSATLGKSLQLAVFWRQGLPARLGWMDDGRRPPQADLLAPRLLDEVDLALRDVPIGSYEALSFYAWRGAELFVVGAARIEPSKPESAASMQDASLTRLVLGRRLGGDVLRAIEGSTLESGVAISRAPRPGGAALPLLGPDGAPVAYVSWKIVRPGSTLLIDMAPILLTVLAVATTLAVAASGLARRAAASLVEAERRSALSARTDGLTGLPNRLAFTEALALPAPAGERAILFLDLNGFKRINDSLGHEAGDLVVARLAQRLAALADEDCLLARIGGDEFVYLLAGANAGFRAEWLAHAAERAMAAPFDAGGQRLRLRAAMGFAVQADAGMPGADLVRQADLAMYEAKRRGDGPVAFGEVIDRADRDARAIEAALRGAFERGGELAVAYQPIVDLATGAMVRAEALARWTSPVVGPVPPDRFVAVAEQSGLIVELGRRLLQLVCDDLLAHPGLSVSLNVSPLQLMSPAFVPDLVEALATRRLDPGRVEVELTERVVVDDHELAARRVEELRAAGFSTALDDFGTGFSSIGTLQGMAFDTLKVDRAFVAGLDGSAERLTLCNAMILLGQGLGLQVVCEGVETEGELDMLRGLGCRLAQGYRFDRPMPVADLARRWLAARAPPAEVARAAVA